ncbi:hypothetical protein MEO93_26280, partial [Dolichospermum sp. ST_sed3]|nr:hypothetical protein [Dolichospermum sp. ST_sed3]
MTQTRVKTKGSDAMEKIAEHYADELDAQFSTLNHFVSHGGEIGRAHEPFLRGILTRFLPQDIRVSSGFVAAPLWTSSQQDILLHYRKYASLFEVGDCIVIDHQAFVGAIEVKTRIGSSNKLHEAIVMQAKLKDQMRHRGLFAIYAWNGIPFNKTIETIWKFVRDEPAKNYNCLPEVVYVRGKYFLMMKPQGDRLSPPYQVWHIKDDGITEGQALLGLIGSVWKFGKDSLLPW